MPKRPLYGVFGEKFSVQPSEIEKYPNSIGKDRGKWYEDRETRTKKYQHWSNIYDGEHLKAWGSDIHEEDKERYIIFNVIKPIVHTIARLLVINNPQFTVQDDLVQEWLDKIIKNNQIMEELESVVVSGQVLAGVVIRTGYKDGVTIDFIHPQHVEPIYDFWDTKKPLGYKLIFENEENGIEYRKEEYYVDGYYQEVDKQKKKGTSEWKTINMRSFKHDAGVLVQYVPFNPALFNLWGSSVVQDTEPLLKEVNNRLSKIKRVLDIFSSPKLILPPSIFENLFEEHQVYTDAQGTRYVRFADQDIYCLNPDIDGEQKPEYVTWDANTSAAFDMLKQVFSALAVMTDVPVYVIRPDEGGTPQSGAALKILFTQAWNRAMSIGKVLAKALETALWQAQVLEKQIGTELNGKEPEWVTVTFIDGLPMDENYVSTEINKYNNGLQSRETTIRNIDNYNSRQLEEEIERIEEEENKQTETATERMSRNPFNVSSIDLDEEEQEGDE
ncbi:phage portal protein [Virgibacillus dakarensis]|nr:phage portal protein [Virgibacillus dakarensis]